MMVAASWLSRLILGREALEAKKTAQQKFDKAMNGHKFEPEDMRAKLREIVITVESKARALSIPPQNKEGHDVDRSGHQPEDRDEKVGACGGAREPCSANG
jgi:hypothetical protein